MSSSLRDGIGTGTTMSVTGRGSIDDGSGGPVLGSFHGGGGSSRSGGVDGSAGPPKELSVFERLQVRAVGAAMPVACCNDLSKWLTSYVFAAYFPSFFFLFFPRRVTDT